MDLAFIGHILINAGFMRFYWKSPFLNDEEKIQFCASLYADTHRMIQLRFSYLKSHKIG